VKHTNILGDYWIEPVTTALCATGSYIYWRSDGTIGRAGTPDGISPNRTWVTGVEGYGGGLAKLDKYVYFTTTGFYEGPANIGRVGTDGDGVNNAFITNCQTPSGVAADDLTAATSITALSREIAGSGLPKGLRARLVQKLDEARAALVRSHPETARAMVDAAVGRIRAQAGQKIPAARAARWVKVLGLLEAHMV
jgi:hypothetical protein